MKKRILILGGGISGERSISLKTAKAVKNSIKKKYNCRIVEPDENLTKNIEKFSPHVVFNALHGRFGEDGFIQTYLESKGLKYTHSGVLSSMMAMDKEISKKIFIKNRILTPKFIKIKTDFDKKKVDIIIISFEGGFMPKGYFLSAHRSPADPEKRQAYLDLAGPAILKSNGKILASTNEVDAHENGVSEQTVLVEFESLEKVKEF